MTPVILAALVCTAAAPTPLRAIPPSPVITADAPGPSADTDFLLRLGLMEGHLMVGHDLLLAHQAALALPHFGHPVRELYDDVSDYLDAKNFPAFDTQFVKLEATVASAPYAADTETEYQAAIETLHKAREITPPALRASVPTMIKICADTLDVASGEYNEALEQGKIEALVEYHDSRGYVSWVAQYINGTLASHPDAQSQGLLGRMQTILAKAEWIVGPLLPSPTPRASVSQYRAVAAEAEALSKQSVAATQ